MVDIDSRYKKHKKKVNYLGCIWPQIKPKNVTENVISETLMFERQLHTRF